MPNILCEFAQQDHTSCSQQAMGCLNIFKSTLDVWKYVDTAATFKTMIFAWNTGESFGLTPFKSDFVNYIEHFIPVKYVTKV